jgi:hypothetical protein
MTYRVYIPSLHGYGKTVGKLPDSVPVTMVVPEAAVEAAMRHEVDVLVQPPEVVDIAAKRAWIVEQAPEDYILMMDDDLLVYVWDGERHVAVEKDVDAAVRFWEETFPALLERYDVFGLGTKYFAQPGGVKENYHLGLAFGFHVDTAMRVIEWNRMVCFEDIDYTLQCLKAGVRIGLSYDMVVNHPAGRVGDWRQPGDVDRDLERLLYYHGDVVTEKPLNPGAHPQARTRIQWKKAWRANLES